MELAEPPKRRLGRFQIGLFAYCSLLVLFKVVTSTNLHVSHSLFTTSKPMQAQDLLPPVKHAPNNRQAKSSLDEKVFEEIVFFRIFPSRHTWVLPNKHRSNSSSLSEGYGPPRLVSPLFVRKFFGIAQYGKDSLHVACGSEAARFRLPFFLISKRSLDTAFSLKGIAQLFGRDLERGTL